MIKLYRRYLLSHIALGAMAISLSGCATIDAMTPCEKAALARKAAEKVIEAIDNACPLAQAQDESAKIVEVTKDD